MGSNQDYQKTTPTKGPEIRIMVHLDAKVQNAIMRAIHFKQNNAWNYMINPTTHNREEKKYKK